MIKTFLHSNLVQQVELVIISVFRKVSLVYHIMKSSQTIMI